MHLGSCFLFIYLFFSESHLKTLVSLLKSTTISVCRLCFGASHPTRKAANFPSNIPFFVDLPVWSGCNSVDWWPFNLDLSLNFLVYWRINFWKYRWIHSCSLCRFKEASVFSQFGRWPCVTALSAFQLL